MFRTSLALGLSALIGLSTLTASAQNSITGVPYEPMVAPAPNAVPNCAGGTTFGQGSAYVIGAANNVESGGRLPAFACNSGFAKTITFATGLPGIYCLTLLSTGTHVKATQVTIDLLHSPKCASGTMCFAQLVPDFSPCPKATPPQSVVGVVTYIFNLGVIRTTGVNFTVYVP